MDRQQLFRDGNRKLTTPGKPGGMNIPPGISHIMKGGLTMEFNLQWFDDPTYSVTIYKDDGISTATASPAGGDKGDEVELSITAKSGYELAEIEVIAGGVEIDPEELTFEIGKADVVLNVRSKSDSTYMVTENTFTCVNGTVVQLVKNTTLKYGKTGAIIGVDVAGTEITMNDAIQNLIDNGVLVKI